MTMPIANRCVNRNYVLPTAHFRYQRRDDDRQLAQDHVSDVGDVNSDHRGAGAMPYRRGHPHWFQMRLGELVQRQ